MLQMLQYSWDLTSDHTSIHGYKCCDPGALQGSNPGSYRQQNGCQVLPPHSHQIVGAWYNVMMMMMMNTGTSPQSKSV